MPYAVGLDTIGTDNPIAIEGETIEGEYVEITWEQYQAAIGCLVSGLHVCVADGELTLDYQLPPSPEE